MIYLITISPRGVLTIPKKLRDSLGFEKKALVSLRSGKIFVKPIKMVQTYF